MSFIWVGDIPIEFNGFGKQARSFECADRRRTVCRTSRATIMIVAIADLWEGLFLHVSPRFNFKPPSGSWRSGRLRSFPSGPPAMAQVNSSEHTVKEKVIAVSEA